MAWLYPKTINIPGHFKYLIRLIRFLLVAVKQYKELNCWGVKKILKAPHVQTTRKLQGKRKGICPLCEKNEGNTEHYFSCEKVWRIREVWDVRASDLESTDVKKLKDVANFIEKVELMVEPMMEQLNKEK